METDQEPVFNKMWNAVMMPQFCGNDLVAVKIALDIRDKRKVLMVASAYFPYESVDLVPGKVVEELVTYCNTYKIPLILSCDANAHHSMWGSTDTNNRGIKMAELISTAGLFLLNRGNSHTFANRLRQEVIDLTLCSMEITNFIEKWHVSEEFSASDHRYIKFELRNRKPTQSFFRNPNKTDWRKFRDNVQKNFTPISENLLNLDDLDRSAHTLSRTLTEAYHKSCPLRIQKTSEKCGWWNYHLRKDRAKLGLSSELIEFRIRRAAEKQS